PAADVLQAGRGHRARGREAGRDRVEPRVRRGRPAQDGPRARQGRKAAAPGDRAALARDHPPVADHARGHLRGLQEPDDGPPQGEPRPCRLRPQRAGGRPRALHEGGAGPRARPRGLALRQAGRRPALLTAPTPMPERLLALRDIGKRFGANRVLEGVSLDLDAGEVHILAGENGAGKTTLIKILAGIHADYEGAIELGGRPVRFATPHEANRAGISVIHQELSLIDSMSVLDNIHLGRETALPGGLVLDRRGQSERALALCRRIGLELSPEDLGRPVGQFPLSVKNLVEIAKALAFDARILVMDEPTSALSRAEVERLFALVGALKRRGCGVIYITHKMEEIYRVADRITVLRDGRRVGTAPAGECPESTLIQWMIGRDLAPQGRPRPREAGAGEGVL